MPRDGNRPLRVLFYSELHPMRNTFVEHVQVTRTLGPILYRLHCDDQIDLRILCNGHAAHVIRKENHDYGAALIEPTAAEEAELRSRFGRWDDRAIEQWTDLVRGQGSLTDFFVGILDRVHAASPIDVILVWSENGAVRRFARDHDIAVLHGELGPTRQPFSPTLYFDTVGTNGNALLRDKVRARLDKASDQPVHTAASWLVASDRANEHPTTKASLLDMCTTFQPKSACDLPDAPYVYIPLQLADDLNTLLHSEFRSPKEFLTEALERTSEMGYRAVIKGHPGSVTRPYNLRREVDALEYVSDKWPEAVILSRNASSALSIYAMGNASYTMTINSSVGFESMMQGVPAVLFGEAIYDAGGWLNDNVEMAEAGTPRNHGAVVDRLVSAYLSREFVPLEIVQNTDYLFHRLRAAASKNRKKAPEKLDFTGWYLLQRPVKGLSAIQGAKAPQKPKARSEPANIPQPKKQSPAKKVTLQNGTIILNASGKTLRQTSESFHGNIETIEHDQNGKRWATGWCLDFDLMAPPAEIYALSGEQVHASEYERVLRYDVFEAYPENSAAVESGFRISLPDNGIAWLLLATADGRCGLVANPTQASALSCVPQSTLARAAS